MKPEARFRSRLVFMLEEAGCQATPVETESTAGGGIPDLELCAPGGTQAWLELKHLSLPVRETSACRLPHFTRVQARWLRDRWRLGGLAALLIQGRPASGQRDRHALLDGETASSFLLAQLRDEPWDIRRVFDAENVLEEPLTAPSLIQALDGLRA